MIWTHTAVGNAGAPSVQGHIDIYVKYVRPQFTAVQDRKLFLRSDGSPFTKDTTCRRLPEIWKESGVHPDLRVTATNIRKWIVTVCHEEKAKGLKFDENALRLAMCHSQKTAQTIYLREDITAVAASATEIIQRCTTTGHVDPVAAPAAPPPAETTHVPPLASSAPMVPTSTSAPPLPEAAP